MREAVNDNLLAGWTLEENQFVGPTLIPEDAPGIIRDTIDEIDFWGWPSITTTATEHKRKRFHECAAAGAIISDSTR